MRHSAVLVVESEYGTIGEIARRKDSVKELKELEKRGQCIKAVTTPG